MDNKSHHWNPEIRSGAKANTLKHWSPAKFQTMIMESGPLWVYQQDPHNTDAFRDGFERIFGKRDDIGSNLAKETA